MATKNNLPEQPGSDLKFRVTTLREDFRLADGDWQITIKDQWARTKRTVTTGSCIIDSEGSFYFTLEDVRAGVYYAYFTGWYEDEDYNKQKRKWTDRQVLVEMGVPCRCSKGCGCRQVRYEQVWTVSIDGEDYLTDREGRYVYTSDGRRIQFINNVSEMIEDMSKVRMNMTGEEFLKLIEGRNPNDVIDTLPEMMDAMHGISDDETVIDKVEDIQKESEAGHSDIDEIFGF